MSRSSEIKEEKEGQKEVVVTRSPTRNPFFALGNGSIRADVGGVESQLKHPQFPPKLVKTSKSPRVDRGLPLAMPA